MSRRSSYIDIGRIRTFLACHDSAEVTRSELEELDVMERALIRQWKYVLHLVTSESPEALTGSENLVSALGMAVGDTLRSSKQFIKWATTAMLNAQQSCDEPTPNCDFVDISRDTDGTDKEFVVPQTEPASVADRVTAKLPLLESMEAGVQRSAYIHVWILEENARVLAETACQVRDLRLVGDGKDGHKTKDGAMPGPDGHKDEVATKTVTVVPAAAKGNVEEARQEVPRMDTTKEWEVKLIPPAVCNTDLGDLTSVKEDRILNLVYLNGYVPLCAQRIQETLAPRLTKHFAVFENGDRTRSSPLDTKGYTTLNTEWGLG